MSKGSATSVNGTMSPLSDNMIIHPLELDAGDDAEENVIKPRRLVPINSTGEVLCYGGTGCVMRNIKCNSSSSSSSSNTKMTVTTPGIRHWADDEGIRAVAISSDETRIVLANDLWEVKTLDYSLNEKLREGRSHPFCSDSNSARIVKLLDTFDAPVRDIQFYPNNSNWVAIATEGGMGIINLVEYNTQKVKYLWEQVEEHHNGAGIRSVAFHEIPYDKNKIVVVLATLSMDGRLCLWDVTDIDQPSQWKLVVRESTKCIPKNDVGEMLDADPWDQSSRPLFLSIPTKTSPSINSSSNEKSQSPHVTTVLALPGMPYLQLRRINVDNSNNGEASIAMESYDQPSIFDDKKDIAFQGHVEPIVALTTCTPRSSNSSSTNSSTYILSSGRDKKVVLWSVQQRKVSNDLMTCNLQRDSLCAEIQAYSIHSN
jgi:hypothetical protein